MIASLQKKYFLHIILTLTLLFSFSSANAHPGKDMESIQLILYKWANAVMTNNPNSINSILDDEFIGPYKQTRIDYMTRLNINSEVSQIDLSAALFKFVGRDIVVSPVIVDLSAYKYSVSVVFSELKKTWKIKSINVIDYPDNLVDENLPEHFYTIPITFSMRDAKSGEPLYARVNIVDEKGEYWPIRGHQKKISIGWREDVGGDVNISGKTFAYTKPDFIVDLPEGKYQIQAVKGMEYLPASKSFEVQSITNKSIDIVFRRWINMESQGWFSGDTHTHFLNDHSALLEAKAEDLNVINVLATKWGGLITNANEVTGAPSLISHPKNIVFFNEETRHSFLGHTILHPIKKLIYPLTWGGAGEGVNGGYDFPPMAYQADKVHAQGGLLTWAHFGERMEAPIDVALGKVDSLDIFTWGDAFRAFAKAVDGETVPGPVSYWYKFLNTGSRLPVTAGTDKMVNTQVSGSVRTYVQMSDLPFTYDGWIDGIRSGRTFVTTGPMISLIANGLGIGGVLKMKVGDTIHLEAKVKAPYDRYPIEKFEIIQDGQVIALQYNEGGLDDLSLTATIELDKSSWFAARAYGADILPYNTWPAAGAWADGSPTMAHTSPIYIDIPGTEIWYKNDAKFLAMRCHAVIAWAENTARYHTEAQRTEVVNLYKKALSFYEKN